jgi:wyosine [tRNA(Phe)-imidazoG37] synthetase (radical SAM superfamily)
MNVTSRCEGAPNFEQDFKLELGNKLVEHSSYIQSITFGYNGEPTLNKDLGKFADIARKVRYDVGIERVPLTLLTNASTIDQPEVQQAALKFDLVIAKIDAGSQDLFNAVNRPHYSVPPLNYLIKNLQILKFKMKKDAKLIIQTLLFKTRPDSSLMSNATRENVVEIANLAINEIVPDQVHVYSIAREPAEKDVISVPKLELLELSDLMSSLVTPETDVLYFY